MVHRAVSLPRILPRPPFLNTIIITARLARTTQKVPLSASDVRGEEAVRAEVSTPTVEGSKVAVDDSARTVGASPQAVEALTTTVEGPTASIDRARDASTVRRRASKGLSGRAVAVRRCRAVLKTSLDAPPPRCPTRNLRASAHQPTRPIGWPRPGRPLRRA